MNRRFGFEKSDHVVADEADHAALEMRYLGARNKTDSSQNFLQIGEWIGSAVFRSFVALLADR